MTWLTIIGMGVITFSIRLSLILASHRFQPSMEVRRALSFVPTAVLSAIIAAEIFRPGGDLQLSFSNERLLAGLVAAIVAWRTKNVILTIVSGLVVLWILQYIGL